MRLKRGQETPFHRLLWWIFLFSFPSKFYHVFFAWFREIKEHSMEVLGFLANTLGLIYSKKAEYLFDDCNKVLLNVKDFVLSNKDGILVETLQAPYFSITLPERFELHAFDLEIIEDTSEIIVRNLLPVEILGLQITCLSEHSELLEKNLESLLSYITMRRSHSLQ
uniref:Uncharacterized protein n=1 Tax=Salix viminalis TaxID=40686 RepID=A0A6N2M205_SALVM